MIERFTQQPIIYCEDLQSLNSFARSQDKNIVFLDATFVLPHSEHNIEEHYKREHIPQARLFDIEKISDPSSSLPHMLPPQDIFERALSELGIDNDDILICYGQTGMIMGPARAWWMLKGFGHEHVYVLDGGLPRYKELNLPVTSEEEIETSRTRYKARSFDKHRVVSMQDVLALTTSQATPPILDARPQARFTGESPEPRAGMRSGHIPKSKSIPCSELVKENGCLKPKSELKTLFQKRDISNDTDQKIITTCGSGITACAIALALDALGYQNVAVYDGSWSEWGREDSPTPIEVS